MAPTNETDELDITSTPITLLWAHQLRREHSAIVDQLNDLKKLVHSSLSKSASASSSSSSAAELRELIGRTEKAQARVNDDTRRELDELKSRCCCQTVADVRAEEEEAKRRRHVWACEERGEGLRVRIEGLDKEVGDQRDRWDGVGEMVTTAVVTAATEEGTRRVREEVERGNAWIFGETKRRKDEVEELGGVVERMGRRVDDAMAGMYEDGVGRVRPVSKGILKDSPPSRLRDASSATPSSFDLDANVADSAPEALARASMLEEPAAASINGHHPQGKQDPHLSSQEHPSPVKPLQMMPVPPTSPQAEKQFQSSDADISDPPRPQDIDLTQGRAKLSTYLQLADSEYHQGRRRPSQNPSRDQDVDEEDFVNAFIRGLRQRRDRQKCREYLRKTKENRSWTALKGCFPKASSQLVVRRDENGGKNKKKSKAVENQQRTTTRRKTGSDRDSRAAKRVDLRPSPQARTKRQQDKLPSSSSPSPSPSPSPPSLQPGKRKRERSVGCHKQTREYAPTTRLDVEAKQRHIRDGPSTNLAPSKRPVGKRLKNQMVRGQPGASSSPTRLPSSSLISISTPEPVHDAGSLALHAGRRSRNRHPYPAVEEDSRPPKSGKREWEEKKKRKRGVRAQANEEVEEEEAAVPVTPSATRKRRRMDDGEGRRGKEREVAARPPPPPIIPILASSEDEFA